MLFLKLTAGSSAAPSPSDSSPAVLSPVTDPLACDASPTSSSWTVGSDTGSDADSSPLTDSA